ncbi:hypothetical protein B0T17DRAFT_507746 [Bombardia bombarda]|uniref:Uncharacterized protein n=1 Tax=Bombardia bombarda TaxID=252184 RepID=A0AA39WZV0_9PEZI|nr:hypothetical protein B0T17DRAFT_507746 [Bombardia bombarda]
MVGLFLCLWTKWTSESSKLTLTCRFPSKQCDTDEKATRYAKHISVLEGRPGPFVKEVYGMACWLRIADFNGWCQDPNVVSDPQEQDVLHRGDRLREDGRGETYSTILAAGHNCAIIVSDKNSFLAPTGVDASMPREAADGLGLFMPSGYLWVSRWFVKLFKMVYTKVPRDHMLYSALTVTALDWGPEQRGATMRVPDVLGASWRNDKDGWLTIRDVNGARPIKDKAPYFAAPSSDSSGEHAPCRGAPLGKALFLVVAFIARRRLPGGPIRPLSCSTSASLPQIGLPPFDSLFTIDLHCKSRRHS